VFIFQSESICRSVSPKPLPDRKSTTPEPQQQAGSSSSSSSRRRKGSMAFVSSSSGKIAKLLRRTHSAGCSKDVPSYALFLSEKSTVSNITHLNILLPIAYISFRSFFSYNLC
jgi:hypothetical protein